MKKCVLTVASSMSDETYKLLCDKAAAKFGGDAEFVRKLDDGVIAGFILEYDGQVFDLSVRTQLNELKKRLAQ